LDCGVFERGSDVFRLELRKIVEDLLFAHPAGEHFKDVFHTDAKPANTWLSSALTRIEGDSLVMLHGL